MALILADRVKETTTTVGTGTVTLSGAVSGFQSFAAIGNANTTYYTIVLGSQWEVGIGTYTTSGTTLSRDTVLESSNSNTLVNFSVGIKDVFVTYPSDKAISNGYGTLPVANGGTGVTTSTGSGSTVLSTAPALSGATLNDGYTEEVFAVSGTTPALSPTNGSIQTWTLTASSTPTAGTWADGQSMTLMINDGTAYTVTWTSLAVTWKTDGGVAPTLNLTGFTVIQLWKVGSVIYGARVGNA
jgi:hypothetical protein